MEEVGEAEKTESMEKCIPVRESKTKEVTAVCRNDLLRHPTIVDDPAGLTNKQDKQLQLTHADEHQPLADLAPLHPEFICSE